MPRALPRHVLSQGFSSLSQLSTTTVHTEEADSELDQEKLDVEWLSSGNGSRAIPSE
jgi:hypothetical protein